MSKDSEMGSFTTESYYVKKSDGFVYHYWRVVGLDDWNVQKTGMKEVPLVELAGEVRARIG